MSGTPALDKLQNSKVIRRLKVIVHKQSIFHLHEILNRPVHLVCRQVHGLPGNKNIILRQLNN